MAVRNLVSAVTLFSVFGECQLGYNPVEIQVDKSKHHIEFFSFVTRPDIDAPTWEINVYNESAVAPGLWFVAPYGIVDQTHNDHAYVAPHIYDSDGGLVWSGVKLFDGYNTFAFQVSDVGGEAMLTTLVPHDEHGAIVNNKYEMYAEVDVGEFGVTTNMHDFKVVDNGTRGLYLTTKKDRSLDNAQEAGFQNGPCEINWNGIEERDIETGEITFSWLSKGRIALDESTMYEHEPAELCSEHRLDYVHLNAVEKLSDGDYLVSGRRSDAIYKVSREDGSIVWRLGGKKNDFDLDGHFSGQHDVRCLSENSTHLLISVMDNAKGPGWPETTNPNSRGLILSVNTEEMTAKAIMHYDHPNRGYAAERGNFQTLPNGNAFICWTNNALCSEHTPDGKVVKVAKLRSGLKTYRGFKSEWIGRPSDPPDVHSELVTLDQGLTTAVHVSWNGDTEVAFWNLYTANANGEGLDLISCTRRAGFETAILSPGYIQHVVLEGIDRGGNKLGQSDVFETIKNNITDPALQEELQWLQDHPDAKFYQQPISWLEEANGLMTSPLFAFFGGIIFCVAASLSALGGWVVWRKLIRRRKQILYSVLTDSEEDRADEAFYDKDSQEMDDLGRGDFKRDHSD